MHKVMVFPWDDLLRLARGLKAIDRGGGNAQGLHKLCTRSVVVSLRRHKVCTGLWFYPFGGLRCAQGPHTVWKRFPQGLTVGCDAMRCDAMRWRCDCDAMRYDWDAIAMRLDWDAMRLRWDTIRLGQSLHKV